MKKKIIILTKSAKRCHDGRFGYCVAGVSIESGGRYRWIRLVSDKNGDSIPDDGSFPFNPLDVVEADVFPCPLNNQIENFEFKNVKKFGVAKPSILSKIYNVILHSFFGNMRKSVEANVGYSLSMLHVKQLEIYRDVNDKQRADFYKGNNKADGIAMTDYSENYRFCTRKGTKERKKITEAYIVVSLPSNPPYIKFIAKIFPIK